MVSRKVGFAAGRPEIPGSIPVGRFERHAPFAGHAGANPLEVTLVATNGVLTLAGTAGLTFTVGAGTGEATMTFTGTIADINAALDGVSFLPPLNYTGTASVTITAGDLDATLARLAEQGIEAERPPYTVGEHGTRICFVRDPDGYRIELIERGD